MTPAGLAVVDTAQANGTWSAPDTVEALQEPPDLALALDREPAARRYWDAFPRSTRRPILEWITSAKQTTTREKRINETRRAWQRRTSVLPVASTAPSIHTYPTP